jgi:hypothetical protein
MFTQDRDSVRQFFLDAWRKAREGAPLEPLEQQIAQVVRSHPEYHALFENAEAALSREFLPEDGEGNPFLHLSLHIAILEQVTTDRPPGMREAYQRLVAQTADVHETEHRIMECLARLLWEAQSANRPPDEGAYLACVQRLAREWRRGA